MSDTLVMGAVVYAPKVATIWEGFRQYFGEHGLDFDFILYSNYERQVEQHFAGAFDVAWNSPLAWLESEKVAARCGRRAQAIAMRNTDRDLRSLVIVRKDSGIEKLADLAGKTVGVGAHDSPQATLIPLLHIEQSGLTRDRDFRVLVFDKLPGKHGDHIGGERDAAIALMAGEVDACCVIDGNHLLFSKEGTMPSSATRILSETGNYDHCNFTILDGAPSKAVDRFRELLLGMSYDDPKVRPLLDLEGLKVWKDGRTEGYQLLESAIDRFHTIDEFVDRVAARYK